MSIMLVSASKDWIEEDNEVVEGATSCESNRLPGRRRGATAMEYLFMLSLILLVVITTVGYLGQTTKKLSEANSEAIQNATEGKPPSTP
jgi:Flp pilus assembly pilin Flp